MGWVLLILAPSKAWGKPITVSSWAQWVPEPVSAPLDYLLIKAGDLLREQQHSLLQYSSRGQILPPNHATGVAKSASPALTSN